MDLFPKLSMTEGCPFTDKQPESSIGSSCFCPDVPPMPAPLAEKIVFHRRVPAHAELVNVQTGLILFLLTLV